MDAEKLQEGAASAAPRGAAAAPRRRVAALDAMRGIVLFALTMAGPVLEAMREGGMLPGWLARQCSHAEWLGLTAWDLLMPFFLFVAGASLPFALARWLGGPKWRAAPRLARRFAVLWILGMIAQGSLLTFDWQAVKPFTNTLQAIAVGCLGASLVWLCGASWRRAAWIALALLVFSWAACALPGIVGGDGGCWQPGTNLPERLDRLILGRFQDGATLLPSGEVRFAPGYHYSWIFSSLNFMATALAGLLAGCVLKAEALAPSRKCGLLAGCGAAMLAVALVLHATGAAPIIKRIWSSGMALAASGAAFLVLAGLFAVMDWAGLRRWARPFETVGRNSITAYMLSAEAGLASFAGFSEPLLVALRRCASPEAFGVAVAALNSLLLFLLLALMDRAKLYLRA